jgi:hypothetical protein
MISILASLTILTGFLSIDNQPAVDQRVLIVDASAERVIYAGLTDSTGHFEWDYPEELNGEQVYVIGKFNSDGILTSEYEEVTLSNEPKFRFNTNSSELESVTFNFSGSPELPPSVDFNINPLSVLGIPKVLNRFLFMQDINVAGFYFNQSFDTPIVDFKIKRAPI